MEIVNGFCKILLFAQFSRRQFVHSNIRVRLIHRNRGVVSDMQQHSELPAEQDGLPQGKYQHSPPRSSADQPPGKDADQRRRRGEQREQRRRLRKYF